jgi:hypothetical protein
MASASDSNVGTLGSLAEQPIVLQYMFFRRPPFSPHPHSALPQTVHTRTKYIYIYTCLCISMRLDATSIFCLYHDPTNRLEPPLSTWSVILCSFSTLAFHLSIRFLTSSALSPLAAAGLLTTTGSGSLPRPNSVSTALLVSSSTKLFPILMVVWDYDVPAAARSLGWAVVANNVEALEILLDCGYGVAVLLAATGAVARWLVGRAVLWLAGLQDVDSGAGFGDSGVAADSRVLWDVLVYAREWAGRLAVG